MAQMCKGGTGGLAYNTKFKPCEHGFKVSHELGEISDAKYAEDRRYRIYKALDIAYSYGNVDGVHHSKWVIDQMVRALTGEHYDEWIKEFKEGTDGLDTYEWDEGVAP